MKFGIKSVAAALLAGLVLAGCGQKEENKTLKVGAIAGAESQLVEAAANTPMNDYNLRGIGSALEGYIRQLLQAGELRYNLNSRVLNYSMGLPRSPESP